MPYKDGSKYRAVVTFKNRRYTALKKTKKEAKRWEIEKRRRFKKTGKKLPEGTDLLTLCTNYLDHAQSNLTTKVYKEKKALCKNFLDSLGPDIPVKDITPRVCFDYLLTQKRERSANSANTDRKNLSAMFTWGQDIIGYDDIPINPLARIKKFRHEPQTPETYTEEEILKLLMAADRIKKLILNTYLETAGRRMEVLRLSWDDVNIEKQAVRLWTRKTRDGMMEGTWLPISKELAHEFKWWFNNRKPKKCPWVFPNVRTGKPYVDPRKWFKNWCDQAGVRNIGFHALRRYVASILDDKYKVSRKAIQRLLRHKKEATTEHYLHMIHSDLADFAGLAKPKIHEMDTRNKKGASDE